MMLSIFVTRRIETVFTILLDTHIRDANAKMQIDLAISNTHWITIAVTVSVIRHLISGKKHIAHAVCDHILFVFPCIIRK